MRIVPQINEVVIKLPEERQQELINIANFSVDRKERQQDGDIINGIDNITRPINFIRRGVEFNRVLLELPLERQEQLLAIAQFLLNYEKSKNEPNSERKIYAERAMKHYQFRLKQLKMIPK